MNEKCWTIEQVATHLGVTVDAARGQMSRWQIRGVRHYPAAEVVARQAKRPGRGNWAMRTCIECGGPGPTEDLCDDCASKVVLLPPDGEVEEVEAHPSE